MTKDEPPTGGGATSYGRAFFDSVTDTSLQSARVVVPLIQELVQATRIVDVGCGEGAWLRAFRENGATVVRGIDGPWVDRSRLVIDPGDFTVLDLRTSPLEITERYDIAVCVELVEHIPEGAASQLVTALAGAAPFVLFSAAIPGQGGTHHVNEQWPGYWQALFEKRKYHRLDPIRRQVWLDTRVAWWYRQNLYLYASEQTIAASAALRREVALAEAMDLDLIHRDLLGRLTTTRGLFKALRGAFRRSIQRHVLRSR